MNLELKKEVVEIYYEECINPLKYESEELINISKKVMLLEEIKSHQEAIEIIGEVSKEAETGLSKEQMIKAISADQKFKRMSGELYEFMVKEENNKLLKEIKTYSKFYFPKEVRNLIENKSIKNNESDIELIKMWIKSRTFDLFLLREDKEGYVVYGVVQCKKSIRERVGRDREPSMKAMKNGFFSILISSHDEALGREKTKMREMFSGGGDHYQKKGWDFAYFEKILLETKNIKHIKKLIADIIKAAKKYKQLNY